MFHRAVSKDSYSVIASMTPPTSTSSYQKKGREISKSIGKIREFKYKQVLVLRTDLGMSRGKIAAQAGHAAVSAAEDARKKRPEWWTAWLEEGQCKIAVRVASEKELLELERKAKELRLPSALITDRGLTELPPGTKTCLGIGPTPSEHVDEVTGSLSLL